MNEAKLKNKYAKMIYINQQCENVHSKNIKENFGSINLFLKFWTTIKVSKFN